MTSPTRLSRGDLDTCLFGPGNIQETVAEASEKDQTEGPAVAIWLASKTADLW